MFQNSLATLWMRIENGGITKNISEIKNQSSWKELVILENQFKNDFDIEKQNLSNTWMLIIWIIQYIN